ncbi:unnamed protein product [Caretta caretta]
MWQYLVLSALLLWVPGMESAYVEQQPFLTGAQENPKTLQCTLKQTSYNWMYWDRQMVTHIMEETQLGDTTAGMWRHLLPVLLIWVPGVGSAYVEQLPFLTGSQGHSLVLQCTLKQSNCDSAMGRLVEQSPPSFMVRPEVSQSVTCTLKDTTYLWMSWYWQDAQGHLHFLVQSGTKGDKEEIIQE